MVRRLHYQDVQNQLVTGKVTSVDDLITLNLDVKQLASDVILHSEGPELLLALWHAANSVSVLDPTCGSGAFLFAALNVLEPLYTACLEGMRGFVDDSNRFRIQHNVRVINNFQAILKQADSHPNQRYFILKSIVLNNLYGVDIMEEAVEICKLRLFLKLIAQLDEYKQIEPLPDIDFNIRTGNALVGFTSLDAVEKAMQILPNGQSLFQHKKDQERLHRIKQKNKAASHALEQFRNRQTARGEEVKQEDKSLLRNRLDDLRKELDVYLAAEYGVDHENHATYDAWISTQQPFHWLSEFYGIMSRGGFDVVIGNPPYLEFRHVSYKVLGYKSSKTRAIHALCIERSIKLTQENGRVSMIVPISLTSTLRMESIQHMIEAVGKSAWYANFAWRPGKLFDTVNRALTIFINGPSENACSYSTGYMKWTSESRTGLFERMILSKVPRNRPSFWIPKISNNLEQSLLKKALTIPTLMSEFMGQTEHKIYYRTTGGLYWKVFTDFAPEFYINNKKSRSSRETTFGIKTKKHIHTAIAVLSSDVFWWWYTITSNLRDLNPSNIKSFPIPNSTFSDARLADLGKRYVTSLKNNSTMRVRQQKQTGRVKTQSFKVSKSKLVINEINQVLAKHYGLTMEELDFITNYDIKYRMGCGSNKRNT